jgi:hypothetical protein
VITLAGRAGTRVLTRTPISPAGRIAQDIPANHSLGFAPISPPTLNIPVPKP